MFILTLFAVGGGFRSSAAADCGAEADRRGVSLVYLLGFPGCCSLLSDAAAESEAPGWFINPPASGGSQSAWSL